MGCTGKPAARLSAWQLFTKSVGNSALKKLMKPENQAEANVIKSVLEEHGIVAEIKSFHDTAYDGLFQSQYGWGLILVSEEDFAKAERIVEEWRNSSPEEIPWDK
jgi:type III secretory pathway lipoprotein EscJ